MGIIFWIFLNTNIACKPNQITSSPLTIRCFPFRNCNKDASESIVVLTYNEAVVLRWDWVFIGVQSIDYKTCSTNTSRSLPAYIDSAEVDRFYKNKASKMLLSSLIDTVAKCLLLCERIILHRNQYMILDSKAIASYQ